MLRGDMALLDLEPLGPDALGEESERARVARGGKGVLCPYVRLTEGPEPVVLVHGLRDAPGVFGPLAGALQPRPVWMFLYDDLGRYLDRSGDDLAGALVELAGRSAAPLSVLVVAHSMGGVVARCALNSLVNPRWFPEVHSAVAGGEVNRVRGTEPAQVAGIRLKQPAAGLFARVDLVTVDTPWHGFAEPPISVRGRVTEEASYVDMIANSAVMTSLYDVEYPGHFKVNFIEADNNAAGIERDKVMGLGELDDEEIRAYVACLLDPGAMAAARLRVRNHLRALTTEDDWHELEGALRAAAAAGALTPDIFRKMLGEVVPRLAADHAGIMAHPALPGLIDQVVARARSRAAQGASC